MNVTLRDRVLPSDAQAVRDIVASTGFFYEPEIDVAVELIEDRITRGDASDYQFLFADMDGRTVGYACFGPIACTVGSYDLYWIAVRSDVRSQGVGRMLIEETERRIASQAGRAVYIETSSRAQYEPTRHFYERCGYRKEATLADFYADGDDKVVYSKRVAN